MKSRSWIKAMATSALSSPRTAFRKANSSPAGLATANSAASSATPIPLSMLTTLTRLVQFLDDNHLEEEGLYSKAGVGLERKEILRFCKNSGNLPDLSLYSPHSIASVIKEILSEMYAPLIPADISHELVEAASSGRIDGDAEQTVVEIFKQIRATTREFLQVFLGHLNHLAASPPSRMSVTSLALQIGIALVRPTDDKATLSSKTMMRHRKCVAEFLIRQASVLPYDCATEMNIPAIPELMPPLSIDIPASQPSKQLHFVQVTWNAGELSLTFEQLEEMFGKFGEIENLGINEQSNRAIVAFVSAESAEEAEHATIPNVRIRRRKPRQSEKRREHSPKHSKTTNDSSLQDNTAGTSTDATNPKTKDGIAAPDTSEDIQMPPIPALSRISSRQPHDDIIVVEDIEDEELQHEGYSSKRLLPAPLVKVDTPRTDANAGQTIVDDGIADAISTRGELPVSALSRPTVSQNELTEQNQLILVNPTNPKTAPAFEEVSAAQMQRPRESKQNLDQEHASVGLGSMFSDTFYAEGKIEVNESVAQQFQHERIISDVKPSSPDLACHLPIKEDPIAKPATGAVILSPSPPPPAENHQETANDCSGSGKIKRTATAGNTTSDLSESTPQTARQLPENDLPGSDQGSSSTTTRSSTEVLESKLLDMETILRTSTAALSASMLSNEFERAVLQLHQQILDMVQECLILTDARRGETTDSLMAKTSANSEFLDFLEAQARTQVKILEVEVRAGQELLRLHKTQYEKDRVELEEEITALRVGRTEAERLCAELRSDLRKCRSELACHVANATDIQRQKSALEEKLATSDNQLHAKGIALAKLRAEYDKMHRVAAEAQMRAEKYKRGEFDGSMNNQIEHKFALPPVTNYERRATSTRVSEDLPHTTKLFSKLSQLSTSTDIQEDSASPTKPQRILDTTKTPSRLSNIAALEAMKQQMAQDIQDQIASTKAALREMEVCSASGKTLEEEEEELQQLQQQFHAKSSEMTAAMNESRHKLQELLDPKAASFSTADHDSMASNQEPTIFDSTALVNKLIARAENAPAYGEKAPIDDSSDAQSIFVGVSCDQKSIELHRPPRDAQSLLYKKWTSDRSRKIAQLASYRDQQAVIQAQQSMQAFQQTLADFRNQR